MGPGMGARQERIRQRSRKRREGEKRGRLRMSRIVGVGFED